jgi:hypothetical protein
VWPTVLLDHLVVGDDLVMAVSMADAAALDADIASGPNWPACQRGWISPSGKRAEWETCRGGIVRLDPAGVLVTRMAGYTEPPPACRLSARPPSLAAATRRILRRDRQARAQLLRQQVDRWLDTCHRPAGRVDRHCRMAGRFRLGLTTEGWKVAGAHGVRHISGPTRAAVAASIREWRRDHPRVCRCPEIVGARYADGTLRGIRTMSASDTGTLFSPQRGTSWPGPVLLADGFDHEAPLRNEAGIHACWPCRFEGQLPDGHDAPDGNCIAEVAGWGTTVHGDAGWRAEIAMLKIVWAPAYLMDAVAHRYPEVEVRVLRDGGGHVR